MRGYWPEPKLNECGFIVAELDFLDSEAPAVALETGTPAQHTYYSFPAVAASVLSLGFGFGSVLVLGK